MYAAVFLCDEVQEDCRYARYIAVGRVQLSGTSGSGTANYCAFLLALVVSFQ